jgi:hypothetical protein
MRRRSEAGSRKTEACPQPRTWAGIQISGFRLLISVLCFLISCLWHHTARASSCANPAGVAGSIYYNTSYRVMQYCDGTIWVPGGRLSYNPVAVTFDGATNYLTQSSAYGADSTAVTGSFWARRITTGQQTVLRFNTTNTYNAANGRFWAEFNGSNNFHISGYSQAGAQVLDGVSTTALTDSNWHHVAFAVDLTLSAAGCNPAVLIYIDGAQETLSGTPVCTNTAIDFTETTPRATVGAGSNSSSTGDKLNADLAYLWLMTGTRVDLTVASNLALFISNGRPVSAGANGSTPTGSQPQIFLANPLATFQTNLGTGGGFTLHGTLAASAFPVVEVGYTGGTGGVDVTSGLVGWWKLDDGSGTNAADATGNGNTGTLQNGPT